mgnify:CR=1 FL=1
MGVAAIKDYTFEPADRLENFHGNQLLNIGWDQHLLFCAPFCLPMPPAMPTSVERVFDPGSGFARAGRRDLAGHQVRSIGGRVGSSARLNG